MKMTTEEATILLNEFMGVKYFPFVVYTEWNSARKYFNEEFDTYEQCRLLCESLNNGKDEDHDDIYEPQTSSQKAYDLSWGDLMPAIQKVVKEYGFLFEIKTVKQKDAYGIDQLYFRAGYLNNVSKLYLSINNQPRSEAIKSAFVNTASIILLIKQNSINCLHS